MGLTREIGEFVAGVRFDRLPPECVGTITLGAVDRVGAIAHGDDLHVFVGECQLDDTLNRDRIVG